VWDLPLFRPLLAPPTMAGLFFCVWRVDNAVRAHEPMNCHRVVIEPAMPDIVEIRSAAEKLRHWAAEIGRENTPAPYDGAEEDVRALEKIAALLDKAAEEIQRSRSLPTVTGHGRVARASWDFG